MTSQLSADAVRRITALKRQIAIAQAGLGPIGAEDQPSRFDALCPWRSRIAAARGEIAKILASITPTTPQTGVTA